MGKTIGIVGVEQAKFTPETEAEARAIIYLLLSADDVDGVVSGGCHLGGVDLFAAEIGKELNLKVVEHLPANLAWSTGYAPRNLAIARDGSECHCITLRTLPPTYRGMTFKLCYHCGTADHVKSGGCWTVKQARKMGKPGYIHVIDS